MTNLGYFVDERENLEATMFQVHYELVASALVVKEGKNQS